MVIIILMLIIGNRSIITSIIHFQVKLKFNDSESPKATSGPPLALVLVLVDSGSAVP
jgi:hypothetical protein